MDTYLLIVAVALFLGVMGIVAMLDYRRRTDKAQFEQLLQTLSSSHEVLRATQAENNENTQQLKQALAQLQATIEWSTNCSTETIRGSRAEIVTAADKATTTLQTTIAHHQKASETALLGANNQLASALSSGFKELLAESQRTTKAIEELNSESQRTTKGIKELKASLEESVSFGENP